MIESDDKKERQDYVDIMQENTELLVQLISDILDLSKIEAGTLDFTMDHLDIKMCIRDSNQGCHHRIINPSPDDPHVYD